MWLQTIARFLNWFDVSGTKTVWTQSSLAVIFALVSQVRPKKEESDRVDLLGWILPLYISPSYRSIISKKSGTLLSKRSQQASHGTSGAIQSPFTVAEKLWERIGARTDQTWELHAWVTCSGFLEKLDVQLMCPGRPHWRKQHSLCTGVTALSSTSGIRLQQWKCFWLLLGKNPIKPMPPT